MNNSSPNRLGRIRLRRVLIIVLIPACLLMLGLNILIAGGLPPPGYFLGTAAIFAAIIAPPLLYKRLRNGKGALRGLEKGAHWQLAEYQSHQARWVQWTYRFLDRVRLACWGLLVGGLLSIVIGIPFAHIALIAGGVFVASCAFPLWLLVGGVKAIWLRGAIYPTELWVGTPEFVRGWKAVAGGCSRILLGLLMLYTPLSFLYLFYVLMTKGVGGLLPGTLLTNMH